MKQSVHEAVKYNSVCPSKEARWSFLFSFLALPAAMQLCVLPFLPESPRYLLMERKDEAGAQRVVMHCACLKDPSIKPLCVGELRSPRRCVTAPRRPAAGETMKRFPRIDVSRQATGSLTARRFLGKTDVSQELEEVHAEARAQNNLHTVSVLQLMRNPAVRWQLITIVISMACYQLCGLNAVRRTFNFLRLSVESRPLDCPARDPFPGKRIKHVLSYLVAQTLRCREPSAAASISGLNVGVAPERPRKN
ncbi:Solute carrier family 2, facilitated glucose transporter member 9 [Liparis tanakae]|uniref:Solute carrier family 2, facilitated glucose transporter member 9 n=1 Tax=Liparis tanakae TaxID=230148 RepID=A0A4Z2FTY8_9TELE|nr:Solute carrier family 2, facilitated glucose transporter member 9 [Liparis tanakae]